ncbi:MAG: tyrosine recombinase XerD [Mycoplasmataceae bacterium RV_VA103A]|nr:MAG: tyrosine recombinase XerD [Mycoplasmataceae bacterium RV_VA103A]
MLPSLTELGLVRKQIKNIPNRQGEYLRKVHYCCYLLAYKSGLRISEAIRFDLAKKDKNGLYQIEKPKGKKERLVYVPKKIVKELKENNWKPNQTNRWTFYWFLQKIKRELNIDKKVELTPHTLRRAFTTYHANSGMPLLILQKLLGHDSIRTTILYWRNPYEKPFAGKIPVNEKDFDDILAGKRKSPITENFPQTPKILEPAIKGEKPIISGKETSQPNNFLLISTTKKSLTITNYQPKAITNEISPKIQGKFSLNSIKPKSNQPENSQLLALTANNEERFNQKEQILLEKIRNLEEQLTQIQTENSNLKVKNKHLKALIQQEQETETNIQQLSFK